MKLSIPIHIDNTVEVILSDIYINLKIELHPCMPPQSMEAKCVFTQIEAKLSELAYKFSAQISNELEKELK